MLRKIFNFFGYTFTRSKKSTSLEEIIKLRLKFFPIDLLIDVGANKGDFTEYFKHKFKKCYLFEPNPTLVKEIKKKFEQKKFEILDFGIGKINKKTKLYLTNDTASTLSSIKKQTKELKNNFRNTAEVDEVTIYIKRLDKYLDTQNLKNKKIFLKIDTQGNDLDALISLGKYIKNVRFIKIEMPVINLYKSNYNQWDIFNHLKKNNFKPVFFEHLSRKKNGQLIEYDCFFERHEHSMK